MVSPPHDVDPADYRPYYQAVEVRAADLDGDDVLWHEGEWRHVRGVYHFRHMRDLDAHEVSEDDRATLAKYLTAPNLYVVAEIQHEEPDQGRKFTLLPIRFFDLVTVQTVAGKIRRP